MAHGKRFGELVSPGVVTDGDANWPELLGLGDECRHIRSDAESNNFVQAGLGADDVERLLADRA